METNEIQVRPKYVFVLTSFGKVVGVYANSQTAFKDQMLYVNKGRLAELTPVMVLYDD